MKYKDHIKSAKREIFADYIESLPDEALTVKLIVNNDMTTESFTQYVKRRIMNNSASGAIKDALDELSCSLPIVSTYIHNGTKIIITYNAEYGSHPYEWHLYYNNEVIHDPTSYPTPLGALYQGKEALANIAKQETNNGVFKGSFYCPQLPNRGLTHKITTIFKPDTFSPDTYGTENHMMFPSYEEAVEYIEDHILTHYIFAVDYEIATFDELLESEYIAIEPI